MRPFRPFCGTVSNAQLLTLPATIRISANGVRTIQLSFGPPASSSATDVAASSDSRPATAQPPLPAPTTTKSYISLTNVPPFFSLVIPGCAAGAGPESITPTRGYGFRARDVVAPRNDDGNNYDMNRSIFSSRASLPP